MTTFACLEYATGLARTLLSPVPTSRTPASSNGWMLPQAVYSTNEPRLEALLFKGAER